MEKPQSSLVIQLVFNVIKVMWPNKSPFKSEVLKRMVLILQTKIYIIFTFFFF